jgi:hypothetical protein
MEINNSLLKDEEFAKKVKDDIKQVIEEYECDPSLYLRSQKDLKYTVYLN